MGNETENSAINALLLLVQLTEDLDSMLIELIHFYPSLKHKGFMATAFGEDPATMPSKWDRAIYILSLVSTVVQLIGAITTSAATLSSAYSQLKAAVPPPPSQGSQ